MTWVRRSDRKHRDETLRSAGKEGALLWNDALGECAAYDDGAGRDGVLTATMVRDAANLYDPPVNHKRLTPRLVELGLWHDAESILACPDCLAHGGDKLHPSQLFIHEWWEHLLSSAGKHDGLKRDHERRGKRLDRHPELCAMVRKRDRDLCRYCGILTRWDGDKRSKTSGTYDHVDPFGGNSLANVVVACRRCNGVKRDRTPEQAGMVLLPEPGPYLATDLATVVSTGQNDLALARETGPGQVGSENGSGREPGSGLGLGQVGTDLALASNGHSNGNGAKGDQA